MMSGSAAAPLPFVFPIGLLFWAAYFWVIIPEVRRARGATTRSMQPDSRDAGSLRLITHGMSLACFAAFFLAVVKAGRMPPSANRIAFFVGIVMMVSGSLLRRHCWRLLGSSFTFDVAAHPEQQVVDRGPYAWLRHPSYTGGMLMNVGIGVALGSWISVGLLVVVALVVYGYRISVEERVLRDTLGERYARYCEGRKRLVPFIY
jgi:protein-S-isoprenylcysteine O-methyltransferase Ste14